MNADKISQLLTLAATIQEEFGTAEINAGTEQYQLACKASSALLGQKVCHQGAFPSNPWNSGLIVTGFKENEQMFLAAKRGDGRGWGFPGFGYPDVQGTTVKHNAVEEWIAETGTFLEIIRQPVLGSEFESRKVIVGVDEKPENAFLGTPMEQVSFYENRNGEYRWVDSHLMVLRVDSFDPLMSRLQMTKECIEYAIFNASEIRVMIKSGEWAFSTDEAYLNLAEKYHDYGCLESVPLVTVRALDEIRPLFEQKLAIEAHLVCHGAGGYARKNQDEVVKSKAGTKHDGTTVTEVDLANSTRISQALVLFAAHPDVVYVDEECKLPSKEEVLRAEYAIVVDPLDGTYGYAKGDTCNAVSIGILKKGGPWLGYVQEIECAHVQQPWFLSDGHVVMQQHGDTAHGFIAERDLSNKPISAEVLAEEYFDVSNIEARHPSAVMALTEMAMGSYQAYLGQIALWDLAGAWAFLIAADFEVFNPWTGDVMTKFDPDWFGDDFRFKKPVVVCREGDFESVMSQVSLHGFSSGTLK